jgi:hypothetical protein
MINHGGFVPIPVHIRNTAGPLIKREIKWPQRETLTDVPRDSQRTPLFGDSRDVCINTDGCCKEANVSLIERGHLRERGFMIMNYSS